MASSSWQRFYHADELAEAAAGTVAVTGLLTKLLIGPACLRAADRSLRMQPGADLWQSVAAFAASVPPLEWERRDRLAARELPRVDASHPPTVFRRNLMRDRPARPPAVVASPQRAELINGEIASIARAVARSLR